MAKSTRIGRDAKTGRYIIGDKAFRKISAVEGIKPSKQLEADLRHVQGMSAEKRRTTLAGVYGKKK